MDVVKLPVLGGLEAHLHLGQVVKVIRTCEVLKLMPSLEDDLNSARLAKTIQTQPVLGGRSKLSPTAIVVKLVGSPLPLSPLNSALLESFFRYST
ncbi:hypothetical protein Vi05172_g13619 [Venturia inaequalis]|nr:hypothetical protein Vi05172_g13619 [Venturia inaequalis]